MINNDYAVEQDVKKWQLYGFDLECELFLRDIAERNHYHSSEHFGYRGINMKVNDKEIYKNVVERQAGYYQQKIPEKLHRVLLSFHGR